MNYFANHPGISLEGYSTVNATGPAPGMSPRYSFIPTTTAVGILADSGWKPVQVTQARTRDPFKAGFGTHSLRFQNTSLAQEMKVGTAIPQIALRNGHSGESAFVLDLALLELRCLNGLMVDLGGKEQMRITHRGFDVSEFEKALRELVGHFDGLMSVVDKWRSIQVPYAQAYGFAKEAINLRWDGDSYSISPLEMLQPRRESESESTLWNVFNIVQENLIKGGISARSARTGRERKQRGISNIRLDAKLNKQLWALTTKLEASL
jgi:hypothetical protein